MEITTSNVIDALIHFSPDFEKEITCDRDNFFCILWVDYPFYFKRIILEGDAHKTKQVFDGINALFLSKDAEIQSALPETVVESLALFGKERFLAAKKYLSQEAFALVEQCKNDPPSGVKPLEY